MHAGWLVHARGLARRVHADLRKVGEVLGVSGDVDDVVFEGELEEELGRLLDEQCAHTPLVGADGLLLAVAQRREEVDEARPAHSQHPPRLSQAQSRHAPHNCGCASMRHGAYARPRLRTRSMKRSTWSSVTRSSIFWLSAKLRRNTDERGSRREGSSGRGWTREAARAAARGGGAQAAAVQAAAVQRRPGRRGRGVRRAVRTSL
jgi:hypothetical protein